MTNDQVKFIHSLLAEGKEKWVDAANAILYVSQVEGQVAHYAEAKIIVRAFLQRLLDNDEYLLAATLLWGNTMFNTEPSFVKDVFGSIHNQNLLLLQGSSSCSKTYSAGAWMLLDWIRDPYYTTIKVVSRDADHLKTNLFAHIWSLLKASVVPITDNDEQNITYREHDLFIGMTDAGPYYGFHGVAVKHSSSSTGDLKGFKPKPMRQPIHPRFGNMTRLRILGDECVRGDQRVTMGDGRLIPIKDLVDSKTEGTVMSFNTATQAVEPKRISGWHKVPRRGRALVNVAGVVVTEDHPILTKEFGYMLAADVLWMNLTCIKTIHENLFTNGQINTGAEISNCGRPTWGLFNIYGERAEEQCTSEVCAGGRTVELPQVETRINAAICGKSDTRPLSHGVWGCGLQLQHTVSSVFHGDIQDVLSNREIGRKTNHVGSIGDARSNGDCGVVYGRRIINDVETGNCNRDYTFDLCILRGGRDDSSFSPSVNGGRLREVCEQKPLGDSHQHGSNESSAGHCASVFPLRSELQVGWNGLSREANRVSRHAGWGNGGVRALRNTIQDNAPNKDLFQSVQQKESPSSLKGMEGQIQEEGDWVYCLDVEDNHNFFAEGVCLHNCQNWPVGPFTDFQSIKASLEGNDLVKIVLAFNPEDMGKMIVQMAEPMHGWLDDDLDKLYDWESKQGWHVTRLDGAKSENVIQKKKVYSGILTYEGYLSYLKGDGADSSPSYYTFARGWPPVKGSANTIIPASWPVEARGEPVWLGKPTMGASVDLAFQGADTAQMTVFKWGLAKGWRRADGKYEDYLDRTSAGKKKPRHVLEIHQIIQMEKSYDSIQMSEEITGRCKMLGIAPEWVVVDKSGNGLGTFSHLTKYWGNVMGINWGDGATDLMVLSEDQEPASNRFQGISSEMWFAFREWLNPTVGAIVINPVVPTSPINVQLSSRRFRYAKNATMKVESKDEYKARNQRSCDEADSVIQCVQLVRTRGHVLPGMVEQTDSRQTSESSESVKQETADTEDSICGEGNGKDNLEL